MCVLKNLHDKPPCLFFLSQFSLWYAFYSSTKQSPILLCTSFRYLAKCLLREDFPLILSNLVPPRYSTILCLFPSGHGIYHNLYYADFLFVYYPVPPWECHLQERRGLCMLPPAVPNFLLQSYNIFKLRGTPEYESVSKKTPKVIVSRNLHLSPDIFIIYVWGFVFHKEVGRATAITGPC